MAFTGDLKKLTQFRRSLTLGHKRTAHHLYGDRWELLQLQHVCRRYSAQRDAWLSEPMATQANFVFQCTRGGAKYYLARLLPYKRNIFLLLAAKRNQAWLVRYLLLIGAPTEFSVGYPSLRDSNLYFRTAATITVDANVLKDLLAAGATVDKIDVYDLNGESLRYALGAGAHIGEIINYRHLLKDPEKMAILLLFGGNINEQVETNAVYTIILDTRGPISIYEFIVRINRINLHPIKHDNDSIRIAVIDVATAYADLSLIADTEDVSRTINRIWDSLSTASQEKFLQQAWFQRVGDD